MEQGTGKVALGKKGHSPFFEKTFIFFSYRMDTDLQDIWFLRVLSKISEKTLFFSIILSSIPEAVDWVSFVNLKVFCSSIHYLDCDFYLQDFFSLRQQFFTTLMPHTGGRGVWINNKYRALNNNLNAKKMQYCLKLHFIMSHWSLQCLESS